MDRAKLSILLCLSFIIIEDIYAEVKKEINEFVSILKIFFKEYTHAFTRMPLFEVDPNYFRVNWNLSIYEDVSKRNPSSIIPPGRLTFLKKVNKMAVSKDVDLTKILIIKI